ncbi:pilin, partial [Candidatus Parcubacteria bacterium]|nr:pilin [Candidatus Parcubacteria bacterium]
MRFLKITIPVLIICTILLLPVLTYAYSPSWWPIVPCGLKTQPTDVSLTDSNGKAWDYTQPCNQCLLLQLASNIINFVFFAIVPVFGTLLFIWAGFLILVGGGTGNPGRVGDGYKIFKQTFYGAMILLASWLFTNTLIKTLAGDSDLSNNWYNIECKVGTLKEITQPG